MVFNANLTYNRKHANRIYLIDTNSFSTFKETALRLKLQRGARNPSIESMESPRVKPKCKQGFEKENNENYFDPLKRNRSVG